MTNQIGLHCFLKKNLKNKISKLGLILLSSISLTSCGKVLDVGMAPVAMAVAALDFPSRILGNEGVYVVHDLCKNNKLEVNAELRAALLIPGQVNSQDKSGNTPLHVALRDGMPLSSIKILLNAGADTKILNNWGHSPLSIAIKSNREMEIVKLVFLSDANSKNFDMETHGISLLEKIIAFNSPQLFDSLVTDEGFPELNSEVKQSLIMLASERGSASCVGHIVQAGVDVNCEDLEGVTPLSLALEKKYYDTAAALIQNGADYYHPSCNKWNLFPISVGLESDKLFKALVDTGCEDFDIQNEKGLTALHIAIKLRKENYVQTLIELGARVDISAENDECPIHIASLRGDQSLVRKLLMHGANPNVRNVDGNSPLHFAVQSENLSLVVLLVENGANLNLMNKNEESIMQVAAQVGNDQIINYLVTRKS